MTTILDSARSASARTEWRIDYEGCLTEISPQSMKFTLIAQVTRILMKLLLRNEQVILEGATKEQARTFSD